MMQTESTTGPRHGQLDEADVRDALRRDGAVVVREFYSPGQAARASASVISFRPQWTEDFEGEQFCLGRAWYAHEEMDRAGAYFSHAAGARVLVDQALPGLHDSLRLALRTITKGVVIDRLGWAGTGVHIFPQGQRCALRGGAVHFDDQGLSPAQQRSLAPALTLVLMLQAPPSGGGLRVWDASYDGTHDPSAQQTLTTSTDLRSQPGDLLILNSHRLHQIRPFHGGDRISATLHGAALPDGRWECWF